MKSRKCTLKITNSGSLPENSSKLTLSKCDEEKIWEDVIDVEERWSGMKTWAKLKIIMSNILKALAVVGFLYFFVCSLDLLSSSFRLIAGKSTGAVLKNEYVSNPIVGLMIGILVTVLVQSSSTSTSIIVSMVASGILNVHEAIPMIFGSNVGTSVTNTIVSLTQVGDRDQFRRAFAGATVHDMFNWLSVIVILALEVFTGILESMTNVLVNKLSNGQGIKFKILDHVTQPFTHLIIQIDSQVLKCWGIGHLLEKDTMISQFCDYITPNLDVKPLLSDNIRLEANLSSVPEKCQLKHKIGVPQSCSFLFYGTGLTDSTVGIILLVISLTILCTSLVLIVKILNSMLKGSIARVIQRVINADIPYVPWLTGYVAILIGAILTFIVQSSSVFTSTLTPLIGIGMISVERAYPLTLGSNLGTTTTALLASMAAAGDKKDSIQIALVHCFFNIFGILLFYPIPYMRWPIPLSKQLGEITARYRWFAIFYLIAMFFLMPGFIFALSLGGQTVMWSILLPILLLLTAVIILNILQEKFPNSLPIVLLNWEFLPKFMRSLEPYDKIITALPCCAKCKDNETETKEVEEIVCEKPAFENHQNNALYQQNTHFALAVNLNDDKSEYKLTPSPQILRSQNNCDSNSENFNKYFYFSKGIDNKAVVLNDL